GQWLFERLGQVFVLENRPGADGNLATEAIVRSPADAPAGHLGEHDQRDSLRQTQLRAFCCTAYVRFWHKPYMPRCLLFVRFRRQSRHGLSDGAASTPFCDSTVRVI